MSTQMIGHPEDQAAPYIPCEGAHTRGGDSTGDSTGDSRGEIAGYGLQSCTSLIGGPFAPNLALPWNNEHIDPANGFPTNAGSTHPIPDTVYSDDGWFRDDVRVPSLRAVGQRTDTSLQPLGFNSLNTEFDGQPDNGFLVAATELTGPINYPTPGFDPLADHNQHVDPRLLSYDFTDQNGSSVFGESLITGIACTPEYVNHVGTVHQDPGLLRIHGFGSDNPPSIITGASETTPGLTPDDCRNITGPVTQLSVIRPTSIAAAATLINSNAARLTCTHPGCTTTFARARDLNRHRGKHAEPQHGCFVNNCDRNGKNAFYRADKFRDHQRQKHKMAV